MSEQGVIMIIAIVGVTMVALVVALIIFAIAKKEAGKKIHIGDINKPININNIGGGTVNVAQDTGAPVTQAMAIKSSIKFHLSMFTFLPPSFSIIAVTIWRFNPALALISNTLIWASLALLIPAIYGEWHRPVSTLNRILLTLNILFVVLLVITILAPQIQMIEVLLGMSLVVIGFALASWGYRKTI